MVTRLDVRLLIQPKGFRLARPNMGCSSSHNTGPVENFATGIPTSKRLPSRGERAHMPTMTKTELGVRHVDDRCLD